MFRRNDPRLRRTLNQISQNLESANESAQAGLFDFNQHFIQPCVAGIGECLTSCVKPCFGTREEQLRRQRRRTRGRAELSFDFYDDWDADEDGGILGWGNNDELDRLLAGSGAASAAQSKRIERQQPGRQRAMSYGTRRDQRGRRKSAVQPHDGGPDPTIIPHSSVLGFLERLPWKIGGKGLRYKPSAADLTDHPGGYRQEGEEAEPLMESQDGDAGTIEGRKKRGHNRDRSYTATSGHTTDSLSSRGDIFPSEDELDDAQPLDDDFAMALQRRVTNLGSDEASSGKTRGGKRPSGSRMSTRSVSSKSIGEGLHKVTSGGGLSEEAIEEVPTLTDLKQQEERVRLEEEAEVERKREAAQRLATKRGLSTDEHAVDDLKAESTAESTTSEIVPPPDVQSPDPLSGSESFPSFDAQAQPTSPPFSEPVSPSPHTSEIQSTGFVPAQLPRFSQQPD
ncbi:hypothetical protein NA57DRAFT_76188 [Rhizodiscina lignyota]|uniref:Uncharacterized protein n=1 Tax=Rhizodiscina lignyota TaxID=1504668 RepID=A0A9P4IGP3_9PEZI|nr:hypothetical protein NA57DRAFT_76188 [Rhizodiscina lignyota]